MRLTRIQGVVVAAWVAIVLLCAAVCQAATLPQPLLKIQPNLCQIKAFEGRGWRSVGTALYVGAGLVVTAEHVIDSAVGGRVEVSFVAGRKYLGIVVGRSVDSDVAVVRIRRPIETAIRGVRLLRRNPVIGEVTWKAGFGGNGKLKWYRGKVMSFWSRKSDADSKVRWYHTSSPSEPGDSGGPVFTLTADGPRFIGNLWGDVSGDNPYTSAVMPSEMAEVLGEAAGVIDLEARLLECASGACPVGASRTRMTQSRRGGLLGGLLGGRSGSAAQGRVTQPRQPDQNTVGLPAEGAPLFDTTIVDQQFAAMQDQIARSQEALQLATDRLAAQKESQRQSETDGLKAEVDGLRTDLEAAKMPAFVDPISTSGPREGTTPSQNSITEMAENYLPWLALAVVVIYFLWRDRKQDGNTTPADVIEAVAAGKQAKAAVEAFMQQPSPPPMPTPQPPQMAGAVSLDGIGKPQSLTAVARSVAAEVKEMKAVLGEVQVSAGTTISRAQEDNQRDGAVLAEAAKEVGA